MHQLFAYLFPLFELVAQTKLHFSLKTDLHYRQIFNYNNKYGAYNLYYSFTKKRKNVTYEFVT